MCLSLRLEYIKLSCITTTISCLNRVWNSIFMIHKNRRGIGKANRHYCEFLVTIHNSKYGFGDVFRVNYMMIISKPQIKLRKDFCSWKWLNKSYNRDKGYLFFYCKPCSTPYNQYMTLRFHLSSFSPIKTRVSLWWHTWVKYNSSAIAHLTESLIFVTLLGP